MADLNCSIEVDFSFEQTDCHWELNRFFRLTWDQADGQNLYYRLDTTDNANNRLGYKNIEADKIYTKRDSYIYEIPFSTFTSDEIAAARAYDPNDKGDYGWITLSVSNSTGTSKKTFKKFYFLELPPVITKAANEKVITTDFVIDNPGEIKVSWKPAIELDDPDAENSPDDLDGYSIEVFHCPKELDHNNPENFTRLSGLQWQDADPKTGMPTTGVYKLIKDPDYTEPEFTELPTDKEKLEELLSNDFSMESQHTKSEVRIENPLTTEFYFNPKHLDIKPSDHYKFVIRPYSHYEGALISNEGTESEVYKVRPGFVHVKTANGWEAGQVWVYTEKGWIVAEAVYTKTADGWKEAI
jgi:hypothetical protein